MGSSLCPHCDRKITLDSEPEIGDHIQCEACSTEVVVSWLNPIELLVIDSDEMEMQGGYDDFEDLELDIPDNDLYAESYVENFQKIKQSSKQKKGGYDASRKTQEKHQEKHQHDWKEEYW